MTYAQVDSVVWDDQHFCTLKDREKIVWLLLLTGPQVTALPGLMKGGIASLSEVARMPVEEMRAALEELERRGMVQRDEEARVLRLPKAPEHRQAQSQTQVYAWWKHWKDIPPCALKDAHLATLRDNARLDRDSHSKVWQETFGTLADPPQPVDYPPHRPWSTPSTNGRTLSPQAVEHPPHVSVSVSETVSVAVSEAPREAAETATAPPERSRSEPESAPERPHRPLATPKTAAEPLKLAEPPTTPSAPVVEPDPPGERKERIERILVLLQNASELGKIANRTQAGRVYNLTHNTTVNDRILEQVIDELNAKANPDWNEEVLSQKLGAYLRNARSHPHRYVKAPSALPVRKSGPLAIERYVPVPEPEDGIVLTKEIWDDLLKTMDNGMNPRSRKRAGNELRAARGGRGQARGPARA